MSKQLKIGEGLLSRMGELGLHELRNAAAFDNSNVVDDIRQTTGPQQEQAPALEQMQQQQDQALDMQQEM